MLCALSAPRAIICCQFSHQCHVTSKLVAWFGGGPTSCPCAHFGGTGWGSDLQALASEHHNMETIFLRNFQQLSRKCITQFTSNLVCTFIWWVWRTYWFFGHVCPILGYSGFNCVLQNIAGTLGCVFIENETHESGVTKCMTDHSVESPSTVDPQWDIWYWGSKWNLHTVCWSAVGCEWGTNSVYFGITYVCFIPSRLPVFAVEPQYLLQDFLFLSKVSFEGHIQNLQKKSCWFKFEWGL